VEFLVPTLAPVSSVSILLLTNLAQVTDGDATDLVVDAPLYDVLGEGVQEVVFPSGQPLSGVERTLRWPILAFGIVLVTSEVVLVLLESVPRIQLGVTVVVSDGEVVLDAEVDARRIVAGRVLDGDFHLADEVEFPAVAVPHGSDLLYVLHSHIRSCLVLTQDEVRTVGLQVEALAQSEPVVRGVVLDAVLFPRHGGAWMIVASLSIAGWIRVCVAVLALFEPTVERLSEFFENALT
jgi:hypothetical protein